MPLHVLETTQLNHSTTPSLLHKCHVKSSQPQPWCRIQLPKRHWLLYVTWPQTQILTKIYRQTFSFSGETSENKSHTDVSSCGSLNHVQKQQQQQNNRYAYLTPFQRNHFGELRGTEHLIVIVQLLIRCCLKELVAVTRCIGEELPWVPRLAKVCWPFQNPNTRPRGVGHADEHVGHMELLQQEHKSAGWADRYGPSYNKTPARWTWTCTRDKAIKIPPLRTLSSCSFVLFTHFYGGWRIFFSVI